jgi:hypothetical protein
MCECEDFPCCGHDGGDTLLDRDYGYWFDFDLDFDAIEVCPDCGETDECDCDW